MQAGVFAIKINAASIGGTNLGARYLAVSDQVRAMNRYFFDLHNGDGPIRDEHGTELPSRSTIPREIARILLDIARDELPVGDRTVISVTVRDESGRAISVASLTYNNEWLDGGQ
jgi:hypothetical protein